MYGHMKHTNSHNYTEEGDRKVHNERMQYNLHHREQSQCDKEIPVSAVLSFMFLIMHRVVSCNSDYSQVMRLTGYSVPFTLTVLRRPSIKSGRHLRRVTEIFGKKGAVRYVGFLMIGSAETTPCENTKEPTPRSICEEG